MTEKKGIRKRQINWRKVLEKYESREKNINCKIINYKLFNVEENQKIYQVKL